MSNIADGMRVFDHRGALQGVVDGVDADSIGVSRRGVSGLELHWISRAAIDWVDHAVHLYQGASDVGVGAIGGSPDASGKIGAGTRVAWANFARAGRLLAVVLGLALIAVVAIMVLRPMRGDATRTAAAPLALPDGRTISIAPGSVNDEIRRFLGSSEPSPRTFTLAALDFADGKADIPKRGAANLAMLAQILAAYPAARVEIVGYRDLPRSAGAATEIDNITVQGQERAAAIARVLIARGVPRRAITVTSGDDRAYLDRMMPPQGEGGDRHPDLIVTRN